MYVFPYKNINKNSRIAIYGAGEVGQDYFLQNMCSGYCELIVWVDREYDKYQKLYWPVYPIECLKYLQIDSVIIATKSIGTTKKIIANLIEMGIERQKLVVFDNIKYFEFWVAQDIYEKKERSKSEDKYLLMNKTQNPRFWLVNTPYHGNLGDYAIEIAEKHFLSDCFPNMDVNSVSSREYDNNINIIKDQVGVDDVIFITGGGYMGELWENEDSRVKDIISRFSNNKIVFFPQTFYYSLVNEKCKSDRCFYNQRNNILYLHRNRKSHDFFINQVVKDRKKNFCFPDIAMYLRIDCNKIGEREGVLLCFRSDKESILTFEEKKEIRNLLDQNRLQYVESDTVVNFAIPPNAIEGVFDTKLQEYQRSKLVITDRLHSMIFAYITNTPCIVFDNVSQKISGVYEWIENTRSIIFKTDLKSLEYDIQRLLSGNIECTQQNELMEMYIKLKECIKKFINE